jgi:hypothetical protein
LAFGVGGIVCRIPLFFTIKPAFAVALKHAGERQDLDFKA